MGFANKAFGRATSLSRRSNVLPEDADTPQKSVDMLRGKRRIKGGSVFARSYKRATRSSQQGQAAEQGQYYTI